MRKFVTGLTMFFALFAFTVAQAQFAQDWEVATTLKHTDVDSLYAADFSGNSRTVIGGFDLDQDGKPEAIITDYSGFTVRVFEYDSGSNSFELVWTAPPDTSGLNRRPGSNPRVVITSDFDGDGKAEITFPLATTPNGWYVYEWDGVQGSDNYGTTYSSLITTEIDTCCGADPNAFRADHERVTVIDIDGDGKQEFITAIRRNAAGGLRGTLISSVDGDIEHNSGGTGFETWNVEYFIDRGNYGGGSPYQALPADLDGDGTYELVNHTWNYFNFFNIDVTGTDSYAVADPASPTRFYQVTAPDDHVSLFGGDAGDIDGDGDDEAFFPNYYTGDLFVIDYKSGDDVLAIDSSHVANVGNVGVFYASVFDVDQNGRANVFVGSSRPRVVSSVELTGTNPLEPGDYTTTVIYEGESDLIATIINSTDSLGVVTSDTTRSGAFASKVQAHWDGNPIDFDNDGQYELLVSLQGNFDSTRTITRVWADSSWDTTAYAAVVNEKSWPLIRIEFTGTGTSVQTYEAANFVTPDNYILEQNYPNPFNPETTIRYTLPLNKQISVKIYNMMGQVVRTLVDNKLQTAGDYSVVWDGRDDAGVRAASGTYIYTLEFGNFKKSQRMTLVK